MEQLKTKKQDICIALFGDTYNNVSLLLKQIAKAYNSGLIEHKEEYKDLLTIYNALNSNDISVLKNLAKYKNHNFEGVLYDAYKDSLYKTFESIKNSCYGFNNQDFDGKLSQQNGVKVYNIKKLPKKMLVNVSRLSRDTVSSDYETTKYLDEYVGQRSYRDVNQDYKSLSFIDNHDIKTYRNVNDFVTFVYPSDIPNNMLITITKKDAWIKFKDKNVYANTAPFFNNAQTLLDSTNDFNEVAVLRKDPHSETQIKPCAILCTKKITQQEQQIAKILNIPIIYSEAEYIQRKFANKKKFDYQTNQTQKTKPDFDELTLK